MGKAGRWLRSFLTGKREKKAARDKGKADALPLTPAAKEKRRWSFRRPAAAGSGKDACTSGTGQGQLASTSSHCFSEVHVVVQQDRHAAAASEAAIAAATVDPPASEGTAEDTAAIRIQSAFRSYLARKALCALRGMVRLQAMVRGQLVRRQADMTLRRIQALVAAQRRARAERLRLLEDGKTAADTPRPRTSRRSPQHHRFSRKPPSEAVDGGSEENVKVVEVDTGGGEARARRSSCCSTTGKAELYYQKASPTPSGALTDATARTFSGRFEDEHSASFSAASDASGRHRGGGGTDHAAAALLLPRSYMANTESSRAKARSQSAPRHRHAAVGSETPASPSCERPPSRSGGRRRVSLDPQDIAAAGARAPSPRSSDAGMERCACPWLDRPTTVPSLPGSECGSSCTVPTSARIA